MRFVVSAGSNIGDSGGILADAVARLGQTPGVTVDVVSSVYRTAPQGGVEQPDFLNLVVVGRTTLAPLDLLRACQAIEQAHHRTRDVRWGPRTLDLDVIVVGDLVSDDPVVTLPHPRAHERAFVLVPWLEVDADARLPGRGPVSRLAAALTHQGIARVGEP